LAVWLGPVVTVHLAVRGAGRLVQRCLLLAEAHELGPSRRDLVLELLDDLRLVEVAESRLGSDLLVGGVVLLVRVMEVVPREGGQ